MRRNSCADHLGGQSAPHGQHGICTDDLFLVRGDVEMQLHVAFVPILGFRVMGWDLPSKTGHRLHLCFNYISHQAIKPCFFT